ncbi:MAG: hypothetical protein V7606_5117 [Burkholderiales bacterium]
MIAVASQQGKPSALRGERESESVCFHDAGVCPHFILHNVNYATKQCSG